MNWNRTGGAMAIWALLFVGYNVYQDDLIGVVAQGLLMIVGTLIWLLHRPKPKPASTTMTVNYSEANVERAAERIVREANRVAARRAGLSTD